MPTKNAINQKKISKDGNNKVLKISNKHKKKDQCLLIEIHFILKSIEFALIGKVNNNTIDGFYFS